MKKLAKKTTIEHALKRKASTETRSSSPKNDEKAEISHQSFTLSVFTTLNKRDKNLLYESFILDSSADTYICNNVNRVTDLIRLTLSGECLAARSGWISVVSYG